MAKKSKPSKKAAEKKSPPAKKEQKAKKPSAGKAKSSAATAKAKTEPAKKPVTAAKAPAAKAVVSAVEPTPPRRPAAKSPEPVKVEIKKADADREPLIDVGDEPVIDVAEEALSQEEEAERAFAAARKAKLSPLSGDPNADRAEKRRKKDEPKIDREGDLTAQWTQLKEKLANQRPAQYSMAGSFEARAAIQHPTLGWGFVVSVLNDRLEVLFESGIRTLISNYRK